MPFVVQVGVNTTGHWRLSLAEAVRADKLQDPVTNPAVAAALNGAAAAATTPAAGAQGNDTCIDLNVSALMQARRGRGSPRPLRALSGFASRGRRQGW